MPGYVSYLFPGIVFCLLLASSASHAHEVRPGYLEITERQTGEYDVYWKVPRSAGMKLNISPVFPEHFEAIAAVSQQIVGDAFIERWSIRSDKSLAGQTIGIAGLDKTMTDVLARVAFLDGGMTTVRLTATSSSYKIPVVPSMWSVAGTYLVLGVEHILFGIDHLLFVLALLLIVDGSWKLIQTITAFTIAHSITLALATVGWVHIPGPPVEAIIALSIVFVAVETLKKQQGVVGLTQRQPWIVAFSFGLLHGFGFAGALSEVGLPAGDIPIALLMFNLGVEIGQLAFVVAFLLAWQLLKLVPIRWPAWSPKLLPYCIGSTAAFWVIDRIAGF